MKLKDIHLSSKQAGMGLEVVFFHIKEQQSLLKFLLVKISWRRNSVQDIQSTMVENKHPQHTLSFRYRLKTRQFSAANV